MDILNSLNNTKNTNSSIHKGTSIKNINTQTLKEGIVKGEVIDVKGLAVRILTSEGKIISGKMEDAKILNLGDEKIFEIFEQNGKLKMKSLNFSHKEVKEMQIKKVLSDLGIINSELDESIGKHLLNNELPVNEKMLKDLGRLLKLFNAQNNNTETTDNNTGNTDNLLSSKNIDKGVFMLKNEIPVNLKNSQLVTKFSEKEINIQEDLSKISENIDKLPDLEVKQNIKNILNFGDKNGLTEENIFSKTNIKNIQDIIKSPTNTKNILTLLDGKLNPKTNSPFTIDDLLNMTKNDLQELLNDVDKTKLLNLIQSNIKDKDFSFNLQSGTLDEVDEFFKETTHRFEKILLELQKQEDDSSAELANKILDTKDKLSFSNHIKNNIFLQLPLNINEHKTNGELTIFKDKRKKGTKGVSSALISLDTKSLGTFETFIQKHNNNLNLQFRLDNKEVETLVKDNLNDLKNILYTLRYNIDNITFKTLEQSFSILNTEEDLKNMQLELTKTNTTFDAKA